MEFRDVDCRKDKCYVLRRTAGKGEAYGIRESPSTLLVAQTDIENDLDQGNDYFDPLWEGGDGFGRNDFSDLSLKLDHTNRPLWICSDGRIFLESFSSVYKAAYDFLISVAEPVCRPANIHEYVLTPHSLYAAASIGLESSTIISVLSRLSKTQPLTEINQFIKECTSNYGKV